MRRQVWRGVAVVVAAAGLALGCGDAPPIDAPGAETCATPPCGTGTAPPVTDAGNGNGTGNGNGGPVVTTGSLWPLTQGSSWTYRVSGQGKEGQEKPPFEKTVRVLGPSAVPEVGGTAVKVEDAEPEKVETSWQREENGIVFRVREEDRLVGSGTLTQVRTWEPSTVKALAAMPPSLDWTYSRPVVEVTEFPLEKVEEEKERTWVWRVLALEEEVTVPAGTFKALKVQRYRLNSEGAEAKGRTFWLVPGVGKVREDGERLEELLRYDVKKD
jgi:hypothetical protein